MVTTIEMPFPVLGVAAWSGTGKTTLLAQLLPRLRAAGLEVGVIKHAHHDFDIDKPGKDSYRLRQAGAAPMMIASQKRVAIMQETPDCQAPDLAHLLDLMVLYHPHLVIVEGFKAWPIPKLVLYRDLIGDPQIMRSRDVRAVASTGELPVALDPATASLDLDNIEAIAHWVLRFVATHPSTAQ